VERAETLLWREKLAPCNSHNFVGRKIARI
jgi:hypothetical protein